MVKRILSDINTIVKYLFSGRKYPIQTFTYYVPSPPPRTTGYREKQFDKIFYNFINQGYEIISINTQGNSGNGNSGMWIIATVRGTNKNTATLNLQDDGIEKDLATTKEQDHIEGLYYIDGED